MRTSTGASFYYTVDGLGSIILLTDSAQAAAATYSYDSWGNATSSGAQVATNPWTYAGGYNDMATSNRIKFGARYYNPFHGRFTQVDPSGQEGNRYLYAGANPVNVTDLSGLASLFTPGQLIGTIAVGVLGIAIGAAVCAGSAGVGCIAAAAFIGGGLGSAIGSGTGTAIDGGSTADIPNSIANGLGLGSIGGAVAGILGPLCS
ncbi:RHS repeat-associated core domain-containing protein [Arthrobacter sp. KNU40]|uniref:RHS repeat-associated core domain-containing protein n=1 Tax=Arthrobacter sp. KNU40 TaxID=3447965 RepID=UPI003F601AAC